MDLVNVTVVGPRKSQRVVVCHVAIGVNDRHAGERPQRHVGDAQLPKSGGRRGNDVDGLRHTDEAVIGQVVARPAEVDFLKAAAGHGLTALSDILAADAQGR